ncbi:NLR family CARD domain-containing protein 3-like [Dysidea avara]|uniref:NLR family CARD domain-containing protein 3-like n=1 Tax=Dysidea avara TaxID=196820 RepID=UPI003327BE0B
MSDNGISQAGATTISEAISINVTLTEFYMDFNDLHDDDAVVLSRDVSKTKSMTILNIGSNKISAVGAKAIANRLAHNMSLKEPCMDYNAIGKDGATALAEAIITNKTLDKLSFYQDKTIDEESAMLAIAVAPPSPTPQALMCNFLSEVLCVKVFASAPA